MNANPDELMEIKEYVLKIVNIQARAILPPFLQSQLKTEIYWEGHIKAHVLALLTKMVAEPAGIQNIYVSHEVSVDFDRPLRLRDYLFEGLKKRYPKWCKWLKVRYEKITRTKTSTQHVKVEELFLYPEYNKFMPELGEDTIKFMRLVKRR